MAEIDLLRHGQCLGGDIFRGSTDVALTDQGRTAMHQRLAAWPDVPWDLIVSSPMIRCRTFAAALAERHNKSFLVEPDLREMHFGNWEAREIAEVWETEADSLSQWRNDPSVFTPPQGEPFNEFAHRVESTMARLARDYHKQRLLVVTHGGVLRLLLIRALNLPATAMKTMTVPYAGLVRLRGESSSGWQLLEKYLDEL